MYQNVPYKRVFVTIDLDAIVFNMESMKQNIKPGTEMMGVVKADGYGHGAVPVAKAMDPYVWGYAAATSEGGPAAEGAWYYQTGAGVKPGASVRVSGTDPGRHPYHGIYQRAGRRHFQRGIRSLARQPISTSQWTLVREPDRCDPR